MFQFLIGNLIICDGRRKGSTGKKFQFLIGNLIIASFDYDELEESVKRGYLTLGTAESYDTIDEDDDGNMTYYSYTDDGITERLFRAKDRNNYNYTILDK